MVDINDCILSDWPKDRKGYGYSSLRGHGRKKFFHHRLVYAEACGFDYDDLPEEVVRHSCDNPPCINIDHLDGGTILDNQQDKLDRERQARGVTHGSAKLAELEVLWIRDNYPRLSQSVLARKFNVSQATIYKIVHRLKWTHI